MASFVKTHFIRVLEKKSKREVEKEMGDKNIEERIIGNCFEEVFVVQENTDCRPF